MRLTHRLSVATASLAMAATAVLTSAPTATAHQVADRPLAEVLLADGDTFDHNQYDYDILTQAVLAVLASKPDSAVGVLTDGSVALTAFLPTDKAFKRTVKELTGSWPRSERRTRSSRSRPGGRSRPPTCRGSSCGRCSWSPAGPRPRS